MKYYNTSVSPSRYMMGETSLSVPEPDEPVDSQEPMGPDPECHIAMTIKGQVNADGPLQKFLQEKKRMRTDNPTHDILVNTVREIFRKKKDFFGERGDDPGTDHVQVDCSIWIGRPAAPMDAKWKDIPFNANGWHLITDEIALNRAEWRKDQSKGGDLIAYGMEGDDLFEVLRRKDGLKEELKEDELKMLELVQEHIHRHNGKTLSCCKSTPKQIGDPLFRCPPTQCTIKLELPILDQDVISALEPYATVSDLEWLGMKPKPPPGEDTRENRGDRGEAPKNTTNKNGPKSKKAQRNSRRKRAGGTNEANDNERELVIEVSEAKRRKTSNSAKNNEANAEKDLGDIHWDDFVNFG